MPRRKPPGFPYCEEETPPAKGRKDIFFRSERRPRKKALTAKRIQTRVFRREDRGVRASTRDLLPGGEKAQGGERKHLVYSRKKGW